MNCEICGRDGVLKRVLVEGVELMCCDGCSGYGNVLSPAVQDFPAKGRKEIIEGEEEVSDRIGVLVLGRRRELGLNQEEMASRLGIKASLLSRVEGGFVPSVPVALKIGKVLGLKLVLRGRSADGAVPHTKSSASLTIGDVLKR